MSGTELFIAGAGAGAIASVMEAQAQAKMIEADAKEKRLQAGEIQRQFERQKLLFGDEKRRVQAAQQGAFTSSGRRSNTASALSLMEQTQMEMELEMIELARQTKFKVNALNRGAEISDDLAGQTRLSGWLNAFAGGAQSAGQFASLVDRNSGSTTKLGGRS